jgi:hypothetical protein
LKAGGRPTAQFLEELIKNSQKEPSNGGKVNSEPIEGESGQILPNSKVNNTESETKPISEIFAQHTPNKQQELPEGNSVEWAWGPSFQVARMAQVARAAAHRAIEIVYKERLGLGWIGWVWGCL